MVFTVSFPDEICRELFFFLNLEAKFHLLFIQLECYFVYKAGFLFFPASEDEKIPALLSNDQPIRKWDDEDVDENDIKDSWEDFDEPAPLV